MRRGDWLLSQLPVGMVEDDFFYRFVSIFQELSNTVVDGVDNIPNVVDPTVAPEAMVRWLGSWIGVDAVDPALPGELQRRIVRSASATLGWRGTRRGLEQFLRLMSGGPVRVEDGGGVFAEGGAPRRTAWVRMHVASTGWMSERDFASLIREEVPAHVAAELWVGDRRILPEKDRGIPFARTAVDPAAEGSMPGV